MPSLKEGERMQKCLVPTHSLVRMYDYYIIRTWYAPIEHSVCSTCMGLLLHSGVIERHTDPWRYEIKDRKTLNMLVPALKGRRL